MFVIPVEAQRPPAPREFVVCFFERNHLGGRGCLRVERGGATQQRPCMIAETEAPSAEYPPALP